MYIYIYIFWFVTYILFGVALNLFLLPQLKPKIDIFRKNVARRTANDDSSAVLSSVHYTYVLRHYHSLSKMLFYQNFIESVNNFTGSENNK